ncbi:MULTISPECIES: PEP-CTERM sorting domain-containing protein [Spirulina sp. CCY15215]|uniref:PEP-CTERM sorting domain-containing protein n=1 Tax=Spirulina sp. CCY15215 TaxID=2767591 RepID=UPI001951E327|nr:PEP-CTERM sorting domain-containing protein [Spirulina major]
MKNLALAVGTFSLFSLALANPVRAFGIDFTDGWTSFGDVQLSADGTTKMSTNAIMEDDFDFGNDSDFNFSGNAAGDSFELESVLGLSGGALNPDSANFIEATEGSGLTKELTFAQDTLLSFDWTFLSNDSTLTDAGFNFDDYAFLSVNGETTTLASTNSSISQLISSDTPYNRQVSGTYERLFAAGTYQIGLGVLDVGDFNDSSAFLLDNAEIEQHTVPEPSSLLGLLVLGTVGGLTAHRRKQN